MPRPNPLLVAGLSLATFGVGVGVAATSSGAGSPLPLPTTAAVPGHASPPPVLQSAPHVGALPSPRASRPLFPLPARPAYPHPCPPPPLPPGPPPPKVPPPKVRASALPRPKPLRPHHVNLAPVRGKGMWLTTWSDTPLHPLGIVAQARAAGLTQLWVRTGGTNQGWYGGRILRRLLPVAHRNGIAVIAWDFPTLSDPLADAARARKALGVFAGERIDGFSPDIEEKPEGVYGGTRRLRVYLSNVRVYAGHRPVVATVPRPTSDRVGVYPYATEAPYVDAFAPMVYWSCHEPGSLVHQSMRFLRRLRPVAPIGQSYDMASEGGRHGLPTAREIWRFLDASKRSGGVGASLYTYDSTRAPQWRALRHYPWP
jgi:hypothetical protein